MKYFLLFLSLFILNIGQTQVQEDAFFVELSNDTILAGNVLEVSFVANNISGKFEAPDLEGLNVISGPNTSSSRYMMNGTVTQNAKYSFGIYLEDLGEVVIPPAFFVTEEETLETEPTSIIILPNPEGIIEQPPSQSGLFQFGFPNNLQPKKKNKTDIKSNKKTRKLKKI